MLCFDVLISSKSLQFSQGSLVHCQEAQVPPVALEQPFPLSSLWVSVIENSAPLRAPNSPYFLTLPLDQDHPTALQLDGSSDDPDNDGPPTHLTASPHERGLLFFIMAPGNQCWPLAKFLTRTVSPSWKLCVFLALLTVLDLVFQILIHPWPPDVCSR